MTRPLTFTLAVLLALTMSQPVLADPDIDHETDSLRHAIAEAQHTHDTAAETLARERLTVSFYNRLMFDSLIAMAPEQMAYYSHQQDWEHYYYVWRMMASAYIYSKRSNTALRECRKMYDDAQRRKSDFGIAMASHVMGLAYSDMGNYEEAQKAIERGLKTMTTQGRDFMQVSIYADYSEVLSTRKDWDKLRTATEGWHKALLNWGHTRGMTDAAIDSTVYATYCFVAKAQAERGLKHYDEAERWLGLATRNAKLYGDDSNEGYWHHVVMELAELAYAKNDYVNALRYNDEVFYWARQRGVDTEITNTERQRAEILMGLGRYKEAAELWAKVYEETEEHNLKDAKNQLSEMNSIFQLDEMEMEQQASRTRYIIIIASLVVAALLVISLFRIHAARRLSQKNRELAVALDHAQESDRMKTSFIQHVSHEIRTPLNIITGFTQVLNTPGYEISDDERKDIVGKITDNTRQITQVVNELLDLSASESTSAIARNDAVSATTLCLQAVEASGAGPTEAVGFLLDADATQAVTLQTDAASVVKILKNLLQNAMKFTTQGSITLRTSVADRQLRFEVIDTGTGVPAEAQQRIFEKFEKVDAFREGIGLGLSVARTLARRLGGDVTLAHSDASGSTFVLSLPLDTSKS